MSKDISANDVIYVHGTEAHGDDFCKKCKWAKIYSGVIYCPFVQGSCARLSGTITKPMPELKTLWDLKTQFEYRRSRYYREAIAKLHAVSERFKNADYEEE
ncbi:MAG: hypothetical protein J6Y20_07280 [Lachnospiraceae bacterium]|nr:hypothetical protein [Lachnospiraceae bacterium]